MAKCQLTGCEREADGVVGIELYPPEAVMKHYKTTERLTRFILGLETCSPCRATLVPDELTKDMGAMIDLCERSSGTKIDRAATRISHVHYDDPDYLLLIKQRENA